MHYLLEDREAKEDPVANVSGSMRDGHFNDTTKFKVQVGMKMLVMDGSATAPAAKEYTFYNYPSLCIIRKQNGSYLSYFRLKSACRL